MISNSRYATNYTALLFAVLVLTGLLPESLPVWVNVTIGVALGYVARKALLARLDAQSAQRERPARTTR